MKEVFPMSFILYLLKSCDFTVLMEVIDFGKMSRSSKYNAMITWVDLLRKTQLSAVIGSNPIDFKCFFAFLFYSPPDCLRPYSGRSRCKIVSLLVLLGKIVALWNFYIDGFIEIIFGVSIWNIYLLNFKTKICSKCH